MIFRARRARSCRSLLETKKVPLFPWGFVAAFVKFFLLDWPYVCMTISRILLPTDGSPLARQALHHARFLATRFRVPLHVVHVHDTPNDFSRAIDIRAANVMDDLEIPWNGAPPDTLNIIEHAITAPSVGEGLVTYAKKHGIDLVVMGTHGRQGIQHMLMGSVAEHVVRHAPCPVFTIRHQVQTEPGASINHVLVPIDFSRHTHRVVQAATTLTREYQAQITLMHVLESVALPSAYGIEPQVTDTSLVRSRVSDRLSQEVNYLKDQGLDASSRIRSGHPASEILTVAETTDIDLIAIGTAGRTGLSRFLMGSVAEKVVRQAPCPVLSVRALPQDDQPSDV